MNTLIYRSTVLLTVVLLAACVTPSSMVAGSVVFKRFETVPRKVFVLSYMQFALPESFRDGYLKSLADTFSKLGATVATAQVTGLETDKNIHVRQIEDFQPDMVLVLRSELGDVWDATYRGKIFLTAIDSRDDTEAWKSLQTFKFGNHTKTMVYNAGSQFALDAFQKLLDDRVFIPEKPRKKDDKFI